MGSNDHVIFCGVGNGIITISWIYEEYRGVHVRTI